MCDDAGGFNFDSISDMDLSTVRNYLLEGTMPSFSHLLHITGLVAVDKGTVDRLRATVSARNKELVEINGRLAESRKKLAETEAECEEQGQRLRLLEAHVKGVELPTTARLPPEESQNDIKSLRLLVKNLSVAVGLKVEEGDTLTSERHLRRLEERVGELAKSCRDASKGGLIPASKEKDNKNDPLRGYFDGRKNHKQDMDLCEAGGNVKRVGMGSVKCEKCGDTFKNAHEYVKHAKSHSKC